jgi:CRISPR-associated protein Cmr2
MSYLITLSIGPVQAYISQARRTQDLWQGSRILSYLASAGVRASQDPLASIIYPIITAEQTDNIPNRIVVLWNGDEAGAIKQAKRIETAIRNTWHEISENTLHYFNKNLSVEEANEIGKIWKRQEETWLECYWVVTPYDDKQHQQGIQSANEAMGSRKLFRDFPQINEQGRKCSITGEHEALHTNGNAQKFWNHIRERQRNLSLVGKHERLSAISTIKRLAHEANTALKNKHRYPSTSSIAVSSFKYDVLRILDQNDEQAQELSKALTQFIGKLLKLFDSPQDLFFRKNGSDNPEYFPFINKNISQSTLNSDIVQKLMSIDGDFLFEDTLIAKTIEEYSGKNPDKRDIAQAQQALKTLLKVTSKLNIPKPEPYLVILSMDGDNMGKTLGTLSKEDHPKFSQTLAEFARVDVPHIVENKNLGRVVYAGGDDVLALLPVRNALQVADQLRAKFKCKIKSINIVNHEKQPLTASTGLAYIHHTHNLQEAVNAANHAQSIAKDRLGRNALFVEFLRRSGEPRSMGGKWDNVIGHVQTIIEAYGASLSRNLPYDLQKIAYSMGENVPQQALEAELQRVIKRRLNITDKKSAQTEAKRLSDVILSLVNESQDNSWESVIGWVELARFVAQRIEGDTA